MTTSSEAVLRMRIAELEDEIQCAVHDEEEDGDTSYDLDSARCRLADLKEELALLAERDKRRGRR